MKAIMIKREDGYFIPKIKGYNPKGDIIVVDINIVNEKINNKYKKELEEAICEKYEEKRKNQISTKIDQKFILDFRKKRNLPDTLEKFLEILK